MKEVSIIICAFNEEQTIAGVVKACCDNNLNAEVLVVDDGSTDRTVEVLEELVNDYKLRLEVLPENREKSWAMVHGVEQSNREIILFFDVDVSHVKKEHFEHFLLPLAEGSADMVLGQPRDT